MALSRGSRRGGHLLNTRQEALLISKRHPGVAQKLLRQAPKFVAWMRVKRLKTEPVPIQNGLK